MPLRAEDAHRITRSFRAGGSPYSLRDTCASLLLAEGMSPAYAHDQLGHKSMVATVHPLEVLTQTLLEFYFSA